MKLLRVSLLFAFMMLVAGDFELEIPEHCKNLGFCEDIPNYPEEQANQATAETSNSEFEVDELDQPDSRRVGSPGENVELCQFDEKVVFPKAAVDKSGKWNVVLNHKPLQGIRVAICKELPSSCAGFAVFTSGYEGRCKQIFMYRRMWVLQDDGTKLAKYLKVPSCCSCVARLVSS